MEYKITTEQILEGAKRCPTAEGVLKAMFPDAFEKKEEWEKVSPEDLTVGECGLGSGLWLFHNCHAVIRVEKFRFAKESAFVNGYKFEDGKLWRLK